MTKDWRGLLAALRRDSPLARHIAVILLVKTVLLALLLHALSSGPKPGRQVAQQRAAQQLLGLPANVGRPVNEP